VNRNHIAMLLSLVGLLASTLPTRAAAEDPHAPASQPFAAGGQAIGGIVVSTSDVSSYTYVQIDTGDGVIWAAGPRTEVKEGDQVLIGDATPMPDFYSPSMDRRFELIYFASWIRVHGKDAAPAPPHAAAGAAPGGEQAAAEVDVSGIERPDGGLTVAEIIEQRAALAGKPVTLRGKVVKYNAGIMGKTWIHVRDGTSSAGGANDLTVTAPSANAAVGDTVLVRGTVALDRDFGYGYRYDVLIEDATVTTE